jgi:hypothetical protein
MRTIHLADVDGRDSRVLFVSVRPPPPPRRVAHGGAVSLRRFVAAADDNTHEALLRASGGDYAEAILHGDPEVDVEVVGRPVAGTNLVYLDGAGEVLRVAPRLVEVLLGADGGERERRDPVDVVANIDDERPVRFTKTRLKRGDAVRRFAFSKAVQLFHVDGLTYEYLHGIARRLDEADEVVLLGGGASGRDPVVFQLNGLPWRAFVEGRVDGPRYQLLLRLSNMELKLPEVG